MTMKMPKVKKCDVLECAYNQEAMCHAIAITVGGGECPMCDTALKSEHKGGVMDMVAGVGACKVSTCQFNQDLECNANGIQVDIHGDHPECVTFKEI
jgi:hypothetical protein